jgi:hypothetical protein
MAMQAVHPQSLRERVDQIVTSRRITRYDQNFLLTLTHLTREEQMLVNTLFDRLKRGLVKVADE